MWTFHRAVKSAYPPYAIKPTLTNGSGIAAWQLASKLESLPLALASPLLRLLVYSRAEASTATPISGGGGNKATEEFIQRVMDSQAGPGGKEELGHAVSTIIFVALCDISRQAQRVRFLSSSVASPNVANDVQYWMAILLKVFVRHAKVLDGLTRRQVCWGICALAWAHISPQANGAVIRPLLPRLNQSHKLTAPLVELLSADQDGGILDTVIMAIEAILWDVNPTQLDAEDHPDLCFALHSSFGPFLVEFYRRATMGVYPSHRLFKLIVPLTRISTYLSFFDYGDTKASLTATTFSIMKYLVTHHRPAPAVLGKTPVPNLPLAARRWIYRASSCIATMYLNNDADASAPQLRLAAKVPSRASTLVFADGNTDTDIAHEIADAIERISSVHAKRKAEGRGPFLQRYTLETLCWILGDIFSLAPPNTTTWITQMADVQARSQLVIHLVGEYNLLQVLLDAQDPCIHVNLLSPAIMYIYKTFYPDYRPGGALPRRRSPADTAGRMARALRPNFVPFLQQLTDRLSSEDMRGRELHELLVSLIGIAGYLAFYARPFELPSDDLMDATLDYLHALVEVRTSADSSQLWRHALGTLGSMAMLYLCDREQLESDSTPLLRFRFDDADPSRMAARLLRIFDIGYYAVTYGEQPEYHCAACSLPPSTLTKNRNTIPVELAESALGMILHLWDAPDSEARQVQEQLIAHGLEARIGFLVLVPAEIGWMASKLHMLIQDKAQRLAHSQEHTLRRRATV